MYLFPRQNSVGTHYEEAIWNYTTLPNKALHNLIKHKSFQATVACSLLYTLVTHLLVAMSIKKSLHMPNAIVTVLWCYIQERIKQTCM